MAMANFGMGASPVAWSPERQTSQAIQTPDEMRAAFNAQYGAAPSGPPTDIQPGKDDYLNGGVNTARGYDAGLHTPGFDSGFFSNWYSSMLHGSDPLTGGAGFDPNSDYMKAYNAAPDGSTLGDVQGAANAAAQRQAAQDAFNKRMQDYSANQGMQQNAYNQQTGFGALGGIMAKAPAQQPIDPMAAAASAPSVSAPPVNPTWGNWAGLNAGNGGFAGLGGMQPSASLGGPFAQKNPWSLA